MPRIVEYPTVLNHLRDRGMRCLYHNGGAFGFDPAISTHTIGWIGPPDPTIRPAARPFTKPIPPPHAKNLARLAESAWHSIGGPAWLMPMSHWAYELEFGNPDWLPPALSEIAIDPATLAHRNQADAIEFLPEESPVFATIIGRILQHLANSDFALAFPDRRIIATIHHHRQIWWTSTEGELIGRISM
ncbi:MAG TPA: hypothetical protein VHY37_10620 [Tepidisphaeraceae bacterium]|nr:hypothetical protein [Tepidisphaeraceae bacterium]